MNRSLQKAGAVRRRSANGAFAPSKQKIMAIVKGPFATNFAKKLGKVVFSNRQGVNIARQMPARVKNPQTAAQQKQRMLFTTVQGAYKKLKIVADHSFEGYSTGAKTMAQFMAANLTNLKGTELKGANFRRNAGIMTPNPYIISKGSLTSPGLAGSIDTETSKVSSFVRVVSPKTLANFTLGDLLDATDVKLGQQLTFISAYYGDIGEVVSGSLSQPRYSFNKVSRVVFRIDASLDELLFDANGKLKTTLVDDSASDNVSSLTFSVLGQDLAWFHGFNTDHSTVFGAAVILSSKEAGQWLYSTEIMTYTLPEMQTLAPAQVIETYDPTSPNYLNHAIV